jgi:hypothetical protein
MADLRTFNIPECPDDLEQVTDCEGVLWTRRTGRSRHLWDDGEGAVEWRALVIDCGPLTETRQRQG